MKKLDLLVVVTVILIIAFMLSCGDDGTPACVDNDGDSYGQNCSAGPDCDDNIINVWSVCTDCVDREGDDWGIGTTCDATEDCDDSDDSIYPDAPEICDGIDNQCPGDAGYGTVDEGYAILCDMAQIPAGCFDMGDHFEEGNSDELPVHNVCLSGFKMDVHEVTNAEYNACVDASVCSHPSNSASATRGSYYGSDL